MRIQIRICVAIIGAAEEIVAGIHTGNSVVAHGNLIDGLDFSLECREAPEKRDRMDERLEFQEDCTPPGSPSL